MKNEPIRRNLENEYINSLPDDKRLAIHLHTICCKSCGFNNCGFHYERKGVEHDLDRYVHKEYLEKARTCLTYTDDVDLIINIAKSINGKI